MALRWLVWVLCLGVIGEVQAQKQDYIWLSGYDSNATVDSAVLGYRFGTNVMDFNFTQVSVFHDSLSMNFDQTNTSYCDSDGNLLFYTNGIYVANATNELIVNGDGLNLGYLDEVWDPTIQQYGYRHVQGILALPSISMKNSYLLIHSFTDTSLGGFNIFNPKILVSFLNMNENSGRGLMVYKNRTLLEGNFASEVLATKHGNGRDWWIMIQGRNSNCYYPVLLNDTGFVNYPLNCMGMASSDSDIGTAAFSPDGRKYVSYSITTGVNIFDFDRCSGELDNPLFYPLNIWTDSAWLGNGVAFSPNSRFLYVCVTKFVLQFDMWAHDILGSVDTVAYYDGYKLPFGSFFDVAQEGPNGNIYISCGNTEADYHVILNPDKKGDSCNFQQHGLRLPALSAGVPNFPNYRLGAQTGSACDTLSTATQDIRDAREQILKVFPNPATDVTTVDYGFTDWNKGLVSLQITDALGQVVYTQPLPMYSGFQRLDISRFAAGLYNVAIKRSGATVAVSKLVKQ